MNLTAKQEGFAQAVAGGMNQSDAYKANYSAINWGANALAVEASRVMDNPNVSLRLKELKDALSSACLWTRERSVRGLANIADGAESKAGEITGAIKELNLMHGFNAPVELNLTGYIVTSVELVAP